MFRESVQIFRHVLSEWVHGCKYFQEFGPRFFDMSSASGYMGEKYFQEFGPRFLDMSYCQKGSHLQRGGGFLLSDGSSQGGL